MKNLPLDGLIVLEFSQYLSAPSAGLRLADLGARVIKIERPGTGDAGRKLAIKDLWVDDSSLLFHTINRNKESFTADLKNSQDLIQIKKLVAKADVVLHNFRPGVMEKTGLGYGDLQLINPRIIYAVISGYGTEGPWKNKPGQDLLLQSMTGLAHTSGNGSSGPVPFGISVTDILCGAQLVQGILAALIRRQKRNLGALIEISLMESLLDFQFELLTTYFSSDTQPLRSNFSNGHPLLSAPYGIYKTADGHLALAMMEIPQLAKTIKCQALENFSQSQAFADRDAIKEILAQFLVRENTTYWLKLLQEEGLWAMKVLDWKQMQQQDAYRVLQVEQTITVGGKDIVTSRCPVRINGEKLFSGKRAPHLGEHNRAITEELLA